MGPMDPTPPAQLHALGIVVEARCAEAGHAAQIARWRRATCSMRACPR